MADGRENNGGLRDIAGGRPTRLSVVKMIQKLGKYEDVAQKALEKLVKEGNIHAIKLFFEYGYGKAPQPIEATVEHTGQIQWIETKTYDEKKDNTK